MPTCTAADAAAAVGAIRAALNGLLPDRAVDMVVARAKVSRVPAETHLLRAGEPCGTVWLLVEGAVRMCWYRGGREHIGDFHVEGELVSDYSSLVAGRPTRLHLVTTEPSLVCALTQADLACAEQALPLELNRALRRVAEGLMVGFADRIWSMLMDSPADRYLALCRDKPHWMRRFPQYMLASYLGMTPEGLSKLRKRLHADGARARGGSRGRSPGPPP